MTYKIASLNFRATAVTSLMLLATAALYSPARSQAQRAPGAAAANPAIIHAGEEVFTQRCFACHSVVQDQVRFGPSLYHEMKAPHPKKTAPEIRGILKNGKGKMPSFKDILTPEDTDNLLAYLHSL